MNIELKRPIVALDAETTGSDPKTARILELALIKIGPDGRRVQTSARFNPGMPIPKEATDVHGITDEDVKDCPAFLDKAPKLLAFIDGCDIVGYNSNRFDIPLLYEEFSRAGLHWETTGINFIDPFRIFQLYEKRDLAAAYMKYCGKTLEGAHGALADICATWEVFEAQLQVHEDLPKDLDALNLICNGDKPRVDLYGRFAIDKDGDYVFTFGKYKDVKCKVDPTYLQWMLGADFSIDTKNWARHILQSFLT